MRAAVTSLAAVMILIMSIPGSADIPLVINYQGKVTDTGGTAVADGPYDMQFAIYDAVTGGTSLWSSGTVSVQVTSGIFSVLLGESPQPTLNLDFDADCWMEVTVESDVQSPRQQLGSVGYAFMASGLVPGTEIAGDLYVDGEVGIGVTNPAAPLVVATGSGTIQLSTPSGVPGIIGFANNDHRRDIRFRDGGISLLTSSSNSMPNSTNGIFIGEDGNVAIGTTTTSSSRLHATHSTETAIYAYTSATAGAAHGISARSDSPNGKGVFGLAASTSGDAMGVCGQTNSTSGRGVYGLAANGTGTIYGVYGMSLSTSGYGVYYSGGLGGTGKMRAVVLTSKGPTTLGFHTTAGDWVEDFGEGRLVNGRCHIELDPLFLETVTIDTAHPMKVFVELGDERCQGAAVKRGSIGFDLIERNGGSTNCSFWYRVVAKRKGFEEQRLDYCRAGESDPYLYPELRGNETLGESAASSR